MTTSFVTFKLQFIVSSDFSIDKPDGLCYADYKILTLSFQLRERCEYGFLAAVKICGGFSVAVPVSGTVIFVYWEENLWKPELLS